MTRRPAANSFGMPRVLLLSAVAVALVATVSGVIALTGGHPPIPRPKPSPEAGSLLGLQAPPTPAVSFPIESPSPSPSARASGSPPPAPTLPPLVPIGFTMHVPILMYHLVATPAESVGALPSLVVPPALFDAQLTDLASAGWHSVTLATLAADLAAHRRPAARSFVVTIDDGHVDGFTNAFPILLRHHMVATYFVIAGRIGHPGDLSAIQLRALAQAGMEIGDHSMDHVDLAALSAPQLNLEIAGAAAVLRAVVGVAPDTFAYPFGIFDAAVERAVERAGLQLAVTTQWGSVEAGNLRFEIPRVRVGPGTTAGALLATLDRWSGD